MCMYVDIVWKLWRELVRCVGGKYSIVKLRLGRRAWRQRWMSVLIGAKTSHSELSSHAKNHLDA